MLIESARSGDEHLAGKLYNMNIGRCWPSTGTRTDDLYVGQIFISQHLDINSEGTLAGPQAQFYEAKQPKLKHYRYLTSHQIILGELLER